MNPVTHFEIPTENEETSQKFYADAFGWTFSKLPNMDYSMVTTTECDESGNPTKPGHINGGMYKREEGPAAKSPVLVIEVANTEEACKKLTECGGEVVMGPTQVGDFGIYAQFKDPDGNILGLWQMLKPV